MTSLREIADSIRAVKERLADRSFTSEDVTRLDTIAIDLGSWPDDEAVELVAAYLYEKIVGERRGTMGLSRNTPEWIEVRDDDSRAPAWREAARGLLLSVAGGSPNA